MKATAMLYAVIIGLLISNCLWADIPGEPGAAAEGTTLFMAPIQAGGNNLFHSLILIPPLENAEIVKTSYTYLRGGLEYTAGNFFGNRNGWGADYNAALAEAYLDCRYGFSEKLELRARLTGAALAEENTPVLFNGVNQYLSVNGGSGLSNLVLGVKIPHLGRNPLAAQAISLSVKIPLSLKDNMLDSDSTDVAVSYFYSYKIRPELYLHSDIGYTFAGKIDVFDRLFDPADVFYYGVGLSWRVSDSLAWINQLQGNNNAFREIDAFTLAPLALQTGLRYSEDGKFFNEIGISMGLNKDSADFMLSVSMGMTF